MFLTILYKLYILYKLVFSKLQEKIKEQSQISAQAFLARNPSLWIEPCSISTISSKFYYCMLLALMKPLDKPSAEQAFQPLSPFVAIRLNGLILTMTIELHKMGVCCGLNKVPLQQETPDPIKVFLL